MAKIENIALAAIRAVEERDLETLQQLYHREVTFHWPPGLPYSGDFTGPEIGAMSEAFAKVWIPLQPDEETRRMHPRVLGSNGDLVIIEYVWCAKRADGAAFKTTVLAKYRMKEERLFEARMYYYDLPGLLEFIGSHQAR